MALVTTVAALDADSYVDLVEASGYLASRPPFNAEAWEDLETDAQELRLRLAADLLDTLRFRGISATTTQARAFPRLLPGSPLWPRDVQGSSTDRLEYRYTSWEEVTAAAASLGGTPPDIPEGVKKAQVELAYQVVHSHLLTLGPMEAGEVFAERLTIGKLEVWLSKSMWRSHDPAPNDLFKKVDMTAISIIRNYLKKYLTTVKGFMV